MTLFEEPGYRAVFASIAEVKAHREAFLAEVKAGSVPLADVFGRAGSDAAIAQMKVLPAIEALPEAGKVSTRRAFEELGVSESALIGEVSPGAIAGLPDAIVRHSLS